MAYVRWMLATSVANDLRGNGFGYGGAGEGAAEGVRQRVANGALNVAFRALDGGRIWGRLVLKGADESSHGPPRRAAGYRCHEAVN